MPPVTLLFLGFVLLTTAMRWWLAGRHLSHVSEHRDQVPTDFSDALSLADHHKAADYTMARQRLGRIEALYGVLILLGWTLGGGLDALHTLWTGWLGPGLPAGTATLLSLALVGAALDLPFNIYHQFVLEQRFGFNRSKPITFAADLFKGAALMLLLGAPVITAILWLMARGGGLWWLYAWLIWIGFNLLVLWLYPVLIAPLFNRFEPLADADLARRLQALAGRVGFRHQGIQVMDGSRRSAHSNAYFTGFGGNRRIVLFDTLLDTLRPAQIEAVLAHELGHFKLSHVTKRLATTCALSFAAMALLGWLSGQAAFFTGLGVSSQPAPATALGLFVLVTPVFIFPLTPLFSWASRRHEYAADAFAATHADGDELISALVTLSRTNASTVTPDPVHSVFYDSHPPIALRVAHLRGLDPA